MLLLSLIATCDHGTLVERRAARAEHLSLEAGPVCGSPGIRGEQAAKVAAGKACRARAGRNQAVQPGTGQVH